MNGLRLQVHEATCPQITLAATCLQVTPATCPQVTLPALSSQTAQSSQAHLAPQIESVLAQGSGAAQTHPSRLAEKPPYPPDHPPHHTTRPLVVSSLNDAVGGGRGISHVGVRDGGTAAIGPETGGGQATVCIRQATAQLGGVAQQLLLNPHSRPLLNNHMSAFAASPVQPPSAPIHATAKSSPVAASGTRVLVGSVDTTDVTVANAISGCKRPHSSMV